MTTPSSGARFVLRALVRQLAAGVYALVTFSLLARLAGGSALGQVLLEALVVFAASALVARLVEGPWWTVGLVGPFVALLDVMIVLLANPEGPAAALDPRLILLALPPVAAGLAGTLVVRRLRRASRAPPAGPEADDAPAP